MGIFGGLGKMTASKVIEKVKDEVTKKQNCEQTSRYCNYIKNNMDCVCGLIAELESETRALIAKVNASKGVKISFGKNLLLSIKKKGEFRKTKEKAEKNLTYMYLARDFFTALAKNASGLILKDEELMLVIKFAPYFDGVPVLDIDDDEDSDDSILGEIRQEVKELKEEFISSKKGSNNFDFDEYMYRYEEKLEDYIIPDINSAIERFKSAMPAQEPATVTTATAAGAPMTSVTAPTEVSTEQITCSNCGTTLTAKSKFCLECGSKIEIKKTSFCTECGEPITESEKFCAGCGRKLV